MPISSIHGPGKDDMEGTKSVQKFDVQCKICLFFSKIDIYYFLTTIIIKSKIIEVKAAYKLSVANGFTLKSRYKSHCSIDEA